MFKHRRYLVDGGQIAVGVGEGRVDLNGPRVALQRSVDVLHLLQRVAHVAVGIGERRLDSAQAAPIKNRYTRRSSSGLGRPVPTKTTRTASSTSAALPNGVLVVHERLVELALLLQHRRQVRVSGRELGEDVERLQVETRRLLDEALLALDVGQIVQRVGVRRTQSQRCCVTVFRILNTRHRTPISRIHSVHVPWSLEVQWTLSCPRVLNVTDFSSNSWTT